MSWRRRWCFTVCIVCVWCVCWYVLTVDILINCWHILLIHWWCLMCLQFLGLFIELKEAPAWEQGRRQLKMSDDNKTEQKDKKEGQQMCTWRWGRVVRIFGAALSLGFSSWLWLPQLVVSNHYLLHIAHIHIAYCTHPHISPYCVLHIILHCLLPIINIALH